MKQRILSIVCFLMLSGCTQSSVEPVSTVDTNIESSPTPNVSETISEGVRDTESYDIYHETAAFQTQKESYTVGVVCNYEITYDGDSREKFEMDGVLEISGITNDPVAHYSQNMNSNGIQFTLSGDYYNGRLYNTYNGVNYYEEHTVDQLKSLMLVPLDMLLISESEIESLIYEETSDGTRFEITLTKDAAKKYFVERYDFSDMNTYSSLDVESGVIVQEFDRNGVLANEISDFTCSLVLNDVHITNQYHSEAGYLLVNSTEVIISDDVKKSQEEYVSFLNIDTDAISDADIEADTAEDTTTETFKKRLISRLNYELDEDGIYRSSFNDSEGYAVDFENKQFTYSNHTLRYVYNWNGDIGSFSTSCNYDFKTGMAGDGCQDEVVDMIQNVKNYLQMELYYCGLSLEDLQAE